MVAKKLYFIRHAESVSNAGGRTRLPQDTELSERGKWQAGSFALTSPFAPNLVVMSPFERTKQTAAPLLRKWPTGAMPMLLHRSEKPMTADTMRAFRHFELAIDVPNLGVLPVYAHLSSWSLGRMWNGQHQ